MFVKVGESHQIVLKVIDTEGNAVLTDRPFVSIKNIDTNCYFNGIEWTINPTEMNMLHIGDGVYKSTFIPNESGRFEIRAYSSNYPSSTTYIIDVFSSAPKYSWAVDTPFEIQYIKHYSSEEPVCIIKDSEGKFYNGETFVAGEELKLPMTELENNVCVRTFIPNAIGEYTVEIYSEPSLPRLFTVSCVEIIEDMPITITNYNFKSQDGSDSTVLDEKGLPLKGVKITVYNMATKEKAAETYTDSNGGWSINVRPAKYMFLFEMDGYMSYSFERMVI